MINGNASSQEFKPKPHTAEDMAQGSMSKATVTTAARLPEFQPVNPFSAINNTTVGAATFWRSGMGQQSGMGTALQFNVNRPQGS